MRRIGVTVDTITYNAAISACEKGQQWQGAFVFCTEMRRMGVTADTITYNVAIGACEKGQQWQGAFIFRR